MYNHPTSVSQITTFSLFSSAVMFFAIVAYILLAVLQAQSSPIAQGVKGLDTPPTPNGGQPDVGLLADIFGFKGCDSNQKQQLLQAFGDAITIATAVAPSSAGEFDSFEPDDYDIKLWFGINRSERPEIWYMLKSKSIIKERYIEIDADIRRPTT